MGESARPPEEFSVLLHQAQAGCQESLNQLLSRVRDWMKRMAQRRLPEFLRDQDSVSDIVQESLVDVGRAFPRFQGTGAKQFYAWLRTIITHNAADYLKTRDRRPETFSAALDHGAPLPEPSDEHPSPNAELTRRETLARLLAKLHNLKPRDQQILRMRIHQGLTFQKMAESLNMTTDGARRAFVAALSKLRGRMGEDNSPSP